jgi:cytochrome b
MQKQLIWDIPTRLFHWILVICILAQYATAKWLDSATQWHFYIGYFTLGLLCFRIIWGVVGPTYARFSQFVKGPSAVAHYLSTLFKRDSVPVAGHNPLGGWFVIVMLSLLLIQGISGLFMTDDIFLDGPYRAAVGDDVLSLMNTLHHLAFDILLYVIALHIGAIIFYSVYKKQKLVPPMLHGKKHSTSAGITHSYLLRAIVVALISAIIVYLAIEVFAPAPDMSDMYY